MTTSDPLDALNTRLADAGYPYKMALVPIDQIDLLDKNARYMTAETFARLVDNVKKDGHLSSVPFCWAKPDGRYLVLSGNHRVQSAAAAGRTEILIMYSDAPLTRSEQIAIQLSHNEITGEDDPTLLKELWDEIEDVNLRLYTGLDDKILDNLDPVDLSALSEVPLEFRTVTFLMLPGETDRTQTVFEAALHAARTADVIHCTGLTDLDRWLDAQEQIAAAHDVRNSAVAFSIILDVFERHLTDLDAGWWNPDTQEPAHTGWVPLATLTGGTKIPAEAAAVIKATIDRMTANGDVTKDHPWKAIEYACAEYLAGNP